MGILLLEDAAVEKLAPITLLRPAFDIGCGGWSLRSAVGTLGVPITACVRPRFNDLARQTSIAFSHTDQRSDTLIVNARLVPSIQATRTLGQMLNKTELTVAMTENSWAAVWIPQSASESIVDVAGRLSDSASIQDIPLLQKANRISFKLETFEYPFHVIQYHKENAEETVSAIAENLATQPGYRTTDEGAVLAETVVVGKHAVLDTSRGPIVALDNAEIGPLSFLRGPVLLGPNSRVNEQASLKDGVLLGDTARVGGEVFSSVVECYSNKQHHGFLGDSYVGAWVNLGAGTTNSNLKNTYGTIRVKCDDATNGTSKERRIETGMQFLGMVVGDYSKTAINASIYTGLTIGVCSNLYGTITRNVPSFVNYATHGRSVTEIPAEVAVTTHERMHLRRGVPLTDCDRKLVEDAFRITASSRQGLEAGPPKI